MKKAFYLITLISLNIFSQTKYITKTGTVNFEASVPAFEEVKAKNETTTAILNSDNGEFAALVFVKAFRFKNALMEEHFNENYAESDTYPKATFKGSIKNINNIHFIDGELTFHGKSKLYKDIPVTYISKENTINISGSFKAKVSNFNIEIPKIVQNKVSQSVDISFNFDLKLK